MFDLIKMLIQSLWKNNYVVEESSKEEYCPKHRVHFALKRERHIQQLKRHNLEVISTVFTDEVSLFFDIFGKLNMSICGEQVQRCEVLGPSKALKSLFELRQRPLFWLHTFV